MAVTDSVKTTAGDKVEASTKLVKVEDKVAPTYVGFTKENASTFVFNFSEPINDKGSIVFKNADGSILTVPSSDITVDGSSIKVVLPASVEAGKDITVSFAGLTDFATNILETPFSVTIQKGAKDGVAPEVSSLTPVNAKKFTIKFSEEVQGFDVADLTVANSSVKSVTQDKTDKTKYVVELDTAVSGLTKVDVSTDYADLTGEPGKAFTQLVDFTADTVKPTATAAISVNKDGNQVLTFTTSEDTTKAVSGTVTLPAKAVKNFVTTTGTLTFDASKLVPVTGSSTQYTVALADVKFTPASGSAADLVKDTTYTVDLVADVFADVTGNKNEAKTAAFSFTRGADKDASKPVLTAGNITVVDNDTFTVDFGTSVELDNSTVVNKANYYVAGATIDSVTLDGSGKATVKLVSGSNNYTGNRTVKVTGVKATNGNVMDDFTTTKSFNENVKPTVQSAKVTNVVKATDAVTEVKATAVSSDETLATATYDGTQNGSAVYTYNNTTSAWEYTSGDVISGLNVASAVGATLAGGEQVTVTTTGGVAGASATAGTTTITLTLSEEVKVSANQDYKVYIAGKEVSGTVASVTANPTASKTVTVSVNKELTSTDIANGVTLVSDDYKLVDTATNTADIASTGIKVTLN